MKNKGGKHGLIVNYSYLYVMIVPVLTTRCQFDSPVINGLVVFDI